MKGKDYVEGRSYITISVEEAQKIIDEKHGTGHIHISKRGQIKETIVCGKDIGVDVDPDTKTETKTNSATIHYSKTGTHLVPNVKKE